MSTIVPDQRVESPAGPDPDAPTLAGDPDGSVRSASSDALVFTAGTYVAQALSLVSGLLQRGLLGPVGSGYWALMQTFWTFFSLAPLGAQHGATRQVPLHRGRGDFGTAATVAGTSAAFSLAATTLLGLIVATVALIFGGGWDSRLRFGLVLLGVTAPLRHFSDLNESLIQAVKRFDVASATVVVRAAATLVAQTLFIVWLGFYGVFAGVVAVELAVFTLWFRMHVISRERPAFRFRYDPVRLRELIRFGAPLLVYAQVSLLFTAIDSLIVAGALDVRRLGYYALAVSVTNYILYLPKSISGVLFPRMTEAFARTGDLATIHHYATEVQRALALALVPLAVAAGFFGFPVLIAHALPDFRPAIDVVQIMVAASFFAALMTMPIKVLITAGERWRLTGLMLIAVAINAGLNVLALFVFHGGLRGAAIATATSYVVALLITSGYSLSRLLPWRSVAAHLAEILVVFAYVYGALRLIDALVDLPGSLIGDAAVAVAQMLAFCVLFAPALVHAERRTGILSAGGRQVQRTLRRRS